MDETSTSGIGSIKRKRLRATPFKQNLSWTLRQKKKLLSLLQQYPIDAYNCIASRIPDKDEEQVKEYIQKIKDQVKNKHKKGKKNRKQEVIHRAPLEEWLEISSDMVEFENVDSSSNLAKVMTVISNFEDFQTVEKPEGPDYKSIYKYMTQLLQTDRQEDLIKLAPLESAIMLDMLHSLMEVLSEHDLSVQRNIMKWKYQLMEARDKAGHNVTEYMKKASENDFTDFINEAKMVREQELQHERRYMERKAKKQGTDSKKGSGKRPATASTSTATGTTSANTCVVAVGEASTSGKELQTQTEEDEEGVDSSDKPSFKRHKPGRKGALDPPEIPRTEIYLVMPPKGVEIVNYNPRAKKVIRERHDGKYQALNQEEELINNDLSREITYDVHRTELEQFIKGKPPKLTPKQKQEKDEIVLAKYDSVIKCDEERTKNMPAKKAKLYSLNPFCLPVTLLDLNSNKKTRP